MKFLLVSLMTLVLCFYAEATPVLNNSSLWNHNDAVWVVTGAGFGSTTPTSSNFVGTTLGVSFQDPPATPGALVYATDGNFVGDLRVQELYASFTFNSDSLVNQGSSSSFSLYLHTAGDNQDWFLDLTPPTSTGTFSFAGSIWQGAWVNSDGSITNYWNASNWATLANVDRFGFRFFGNDFGGNGSQTFEFSDVYFNVPEPETVWMILMVLACLGVTFRQRVSEVVVSVRTRITK